MKFLLCFMVVLPALVLQHCSAKIRFKSLKAQKITKRAVYSRQSDEFEIGVMFGDETWEDAKVYCEERFEGGMLLTIPEEDLEFALEEYLDEDYLEEEFWIGANDENQEGNVEWADESKVLWEPDDDAENDKDKNCVALCPEEDGSFSWKFRDCEETKKFLCQIPVKPGDCPELEDYDSCETECEFDGECEGDMKCCDNGCADVCTQPLTREEKPGDCPKLEDFDNCETECEFDGECKGDMKCCYNGCADVCTQPLTRGPCDDGSFPVDCPIDPCSVQTCETPPKDKEINCRPNHCGGCFAEFYDEDNNEIDCSDYCCFEPDSGSGELKEDRWYYDCEKGECLEFVYAGADGNKNNFGSKKECYLECAIWEKN